jgi:hypothetical protein
VETTRGVVPICFPSRNTLAPAGRESTASDPAPVFGGDGGIGGAGFAAAPREASREDADADDDREARDGSGFEPDVRGVLRLAAGCLTAARDVVAVGDFAARAGGFEVAADGRGTAEADGALAVNFTSAAGFWTLVAAAIMGAGGRTAAAVSRRRSLSAASSEG